MVRRDSVKAGDHVQRGKPSCLKPPGPLTTIFNWVYGPGRQSDGGDSKQPPVSRVIREAQTPAWFPH